ncbi:MAG TPA: SpoIIE family protein phosphatase, partial [Candidatus Ozemobacteraceae bacterium]|nr:SpoIIE family protein phosphatase [Candidatus Ozemobacteraceae bacterium]
MSIQESLPDRDGKPLYLVHAGFNHSQFERNFCLKHVNDLRRSETLPIDLAMVATSKVVGGVYPHDLDRDYAAYLANLSTSNRSTVHEYRTEAGQNYVWIAMPARKMSYFFLVGRVPLHGVERKIQGMWHQLIVFAVLLLITSIFLGFMVARQFLRPINDISTGLQAIARRDFRHRVPVRSADELGEVSSLINRVTEGMKDLEVARVVQESLFPTEPLEVPPVRLFGRSFAMADIGGDYFDYFVLDDRNVVGLVGDVSGHGVSAALIMGMAKGAFAMHAKPGLSLIAFFESFNHLLISTAKKKKMMTLFAFAIDVKTLKMEFLNAGHNYPMLYDAATGKVTELQAVGYPLGMRNKLASSVQVLQLHQGDGVCMYTDGYVESRNPAGEEIGYLRLGDWFGVGIRRSTHVPSLVQYLFDEFHQWCGDEAVQDDVSLVCLKIDDGGIDP